ncbi:uncharacterized protein LOC125944880 [Dermacentor silvarum]|uniref:uncharacterized protein LOC125944880 n=1 Tax=Dermacentor silvarum TaxID=543639 RepID=UPI0021019E0D|nr:uncharacterized protein LOC125944880 [Dermacentor silvarum]
MATTLTQQAFVAGMESKDSVAVEKVDLILCRKKKFFKFPDFGFSVRCVKGEEASFTYVDAVTKGSTADMFKVLPLDFILQVNGVAVKNAPLPQVKKIIGDAGEKMTLSVMSSSPYRLLTSRRDILGIMRSAARESAVVKTTALGCVGSTAYGIGILDVDVADDKLKQTAKCFVLLYADVVSSNNKMVFPGDVLFEIDGTSVVGMSRPQVEQLLSAGKPEVMLSVVPLSPARKTPFLTSKLVETGMTDSKVPSKSTAAHIS